MSESELRGLFDFKLNESQMELTWPGKDCNAKWGQMGKAHIGIASISIPTNPEIKIQLCARKEKSQMKIQEITGEERIGIASISIPKNPSDRKWEGFLLLPWIHLNPSVFCTLQWISKMGEKNIKNLQYNISISLSNKTKVAFLVSNIEDLGPPVDHIWEMK